MENSFIKEESKGFESNGDEESCVEEVILQVGSRKRVQDDDQSKAATPNLKNFINCNNRQLDDQLGSSKAELNEAMEENKWLKMHLDRVLEDYRTLEKQYQDTIQNHEAKESSNAPPKPGKLISLSLGISFPSEKKKGEQHRTTQRNESADVNEGDEKEGLTLGLDCKTFRVLPQKLLAENISWPNHESENSLDERKEEGGETRPGNDKVKSNVNEGGNDEITQQNSAKRTRVSVRVRCDTPTLNDGCQWRKYGQKTAKGNPCPRAYYRCTVAPSCPVRKQVQRYVEDMSILITTYEGTHNHPLPISATAMASTTSAAVSMLTSGSSNSSTGPGPPSSVAVFENLNGLNLYSSQDNSRLNPFYLPNSSISSTSSYSTITLDLTTSATSSSFVSSHLTRLTNFPPKYSTTNLNFSSLESSMLPISWTSGPYQTTSTNSFSFGTQPYETLHQTYSQKNNNASRGQQNVTPEAIATATKAITTDPIFRSALTAALSSIIGSNGNNASTMLQNQTEGDKSSHFKNVEISGLNFPILSSFTSSASNVNKCAPSFMNKSTSTAQPAGGLMFLSTPFSDAKSKSSSPSDHSGERAA